MVSLLLPALPHHQVDHVHSRQGPLDGGDEAETRLVVVVDPVHCHHWQILALVAKSMQLG